MKPEDQVREYLFTHKSRVEQSSVDLVVKDVKLSLFYGMSPLSDDEIRKVVVGWAAVHAVGLVLRQPPTGPPLSTPGGTAPAATDSELVDAVKKAISTISDPVTIGKEGANIKIGVTGLTANLKKGGQSASLGISWGGTLKLDASSGPFHFSGNLAKDKWEMTLSFPRDTYIPDLSSLGEVFTKGEKAVWKMAEATRGFSNISDARRIGALVKPEMTAVQGAVEAASGIAKAGKKGGPSFGFKVGSPEPGPGEQSIPGGVQGTVVFTYVF